MRWKLNLFIISAILTIFTSISFAYPNEENGFKDFHWNDTLQSIQEKYSTGLFINDGNITTYIIPMELIELDGIKSLPNIALHFNDNKLFEILTIFDDVSLEESNVKYHQLVSILSKRYGEPSVIHDFYSLNVQLAIWEGKTTSIILYHNDKQSEFLGEKIYTNLLVIQNKSSRGKLL